MDWQINGTGGLKGLMFTEFLGGGTGQQEVEDVEVPLSVEGPDHTRFLQQVVGDLATNWVSLEVKLNLHVLSKATAVVVPEGLGISKSWGKEMWRSTPEIFKKLILFSHSPSKTGLVPISWFLTFSTSSVFPLT